MQVDSDRVDRDSIGELFSRASTEGKTFVAAKVDAVKQTALTGVDKAKVGVGLVVVGGLLAYAGLIIILVALFSWLEEMVGPLRGGLIVAGVTFAISLLMVKIGIGKISGAIAAVSSNGKIR